MLKPIAFTCLMIAVPIALIPAATEVPWETDIDQAFQKAAEAEKWVYVNFYTTSCPYCVKMEREVYSREDVGDLLAKFVPLKVNASQKAEFVRKYHVEAFPTAMVLTSDGQVIDIVRGYVPAGRFQEQIKPLAAGENPLEAMEREAAGEPESATTQVQVGYQFLSRHWYERSRTYFERGLKLAGEDPVLGEEAMRLIIASHLYESNVEKVGEWVERYEKDFPESEFLGPMYFDLGQIHFEKEMYSEAAGYFEKTKDVAEEYMLRMRANWMLSEARGKLEEGE